VSDMAHDIAVAEWKALDSLARYKFMQFGYWAAIWVHLNRISGATLPSPFTTLVTKGRELRDARQKPKMRGARREKEQPDRT
jgi:hypothetical protein